MEVQDAFRLHYDTKKQYHRGTVYTGILAADCKVGDKVVVVHGDNLYPAMIFGIEQFNKTLQEGTKGLHVGLFFSYHHTVPKANGLSIYKA